jgi:hypothetical protein
VTGTAQAGANKAASTGGTPAANKGHAPVAAAVQEATETPAQTQKEAAAGDRQAQKLLHTHSNLGAQVNTKV